MPVYGGIINEHHGVGLKISPIYANSIWPSFPSFGGDQIWPRCQQCDESGQDGFWSCFVLRVLCPISSSNNVDLPGRDVLCLTFKTDPKHHYSRR
jgi:hypothetical protein